MKNISKELKVAALKDGTVIDHIPSEKLFKVISILRLDKLGKKAIIKVTDRFFEQREVNKIAILAPNAKINTIRDYEVVDKKTLELPCEITGVVKCLNPQCITNNEPMSTRFCTVDKEQALFKCHYCERITSAEDLSIVE